MGGDDGRNEERKQRGWRVSWSSVPPTGHGRAAIWGEQGGCSRSRDGCSFCSPSEETEREQCSCFLPLLSSETPVMGGLRLNKNREYKKLSPWWGGLYRETTVLPGGSEVIHAALRKVHLDYLSRHHDGVAGWHMACFTPHRWRRDVEENKINLTAAYK